ncbi:TetR family transcriptional regulator C-terminal domain-containing protein [Nocardia otitidiscaviarum]|uniref:TetR/AcrR family transcriptional regulator n=1 Tax=Nocardia otitidiscaviarum TaxID=1823 RepID=UPI001C8F808C|nr:TetR/AcrR family transcriptional regulator [Nocardia otitidiscaviarum]MCP9623160.1 TetR family transcriptional regulator C-terminal domain-containing protein [Nocardia otitidiscaviarum]
MTYTTDRRTRLADAAIETLAGAGMRGLTHRAVDQAAGLPEGSCSNCFRTRQALLEAAVDRLAERDCAELAASIPPVADIEGVTRVLADVVERWLTVDRGRMLARFELSLESTRRPELRKALHNSGTRFRDLATRLFEDIGAPDPERRAHAFVGCLDGLIFDRLAGAGTPGLDGRELRETLRILLRGFTS